MSQRFSISERAAGVLLHPTSLPGPFGCGDLGPAADAFVEWMAEAGLRWWQMLPTNPVGPGDSPYSAPSAFAGNDLLISLEQLAAEGLLDRRDLAVPGGAARRMAATKAAYAEAGKFRREKLARAFANFEAHGIAEERRAFARYCSTQAHWLDEWALYRAIKTAQGEKPWWEWPRALVRREPAALDAARDELRDAIRYEQFVQYLFDAQWAELRAFAADAGVALMGDLPIFVSHDSADVWANQKLFTLNPDGSKKLQSGVPPDGFSADGQLWGHPLYVWREHARTKYAWWVARFARLGQWFDAVRIDHFLGFARLFTISGSAKTARKGTWQPTPGMELLTAVRAQVKDLQIVAEDLGIVTEKATRLREHFGIPGMRMMHNAFWEGNRYDQPHRYPPHCVAYPGTHDNNTTLGWLDQISRDESRGQRDKMTVLQRAMNYLGSDGAEFHWDMIRALLMSPADMAVVPMQDFLGLDERARMNYPSVAFGNWDWRMALDAASDALARRIRMLTYSYERAAAP